MKIAKAEVKALAEALADPAPVQAPVVGEVPKRDGDKKPSSKKNGKKGSKGPKEPKRTKDSKRSKRQASKSDSSPSGKRKSKKRAKARDEAARIHGYPNIALCVTDAVFARSGRPSAASSAVSSLVVFSEAAGWNPAAEDTSLTSSGFAAALEAESGAALADVFGCDSRALGCSDTMSAEVALALVKALAEGGVESIADARAQDAESVLASAVKNTRGAGPAVLVRLMDNVRGVDPGRSDPWLLEALSATLDRQVDAAEVPDLLDGVAKRLSRETPGVTGDDIAERLWLQSRGYVAGFRRDV